MPSQCLVLQSVTAGDSALQDRAVERNADRGVVGAQDLVGTPEVITAYLEAGTTAFVFVGGKSMARTIGTNCGGKETPPTRGRVPSACVSRGSLFERGRTAGIVHAALVSESVTSHLADEGQGQGQRQA